MDLALYGRVLLRHKRIVVGGLMLAFVLAVLSYYRIDAKGMLPSLEPRQAEIWQSQASIFLTESGFPAGRLTIPFDVRKIGEETVTVPRYSDPGRFAGLTALYVQLATSDEVRRRIARQGAPFGSFLAGPAVDTTAGGRTPLPVIYMFGRAGSAADAQVTAARGLRAFVSYVAEQQKAGGIPENQRIQLRVLNKPGPGVVLEPRKKTLPVVVFVAVLMAAFALAFIFENRARSRVPVEVMADVVVKAESESEAEEEEVSTIRRWA